MKKLLGIVVLGLLWCDVGFANPCDGWSWYHKNEMATFEFENKSDYVAKITSVTIKTQDGKIMHTSRKKNIMSLKKICCGSMQRKLLLPVHLLLMQCTNWKQNLRKKKKKVVLKNY